MTYGKRYLLNVKVKKNPMQISLAYLFKYDESIWLD